MKTRIPFLKLNRWMSIVMIAAIILTACDTTELVPTTQATNPTPATQVLVTLIRRPAELDKVNSWLETCQTVREANGDINGVRFAVETLTDIACWEVESMEGPSRLRWVEDNAELIAQLGVQPVAMLDVPVKSPWKGYDGDDAFSCLDEFSIIQFSEPGWPKVVAETYPDVDASQQWAGEAGCVTGVSVYNVVKVPDPPPYEGADQIGSTYWVQDDRRTIGVTPIWREPTKEEVGCWGRNDYAKPHPTPLGWGHPPKGCLEEFHYTSENWQSWWGSYPSHPYEIFGVPFDGWTLEQVCGTIPWDGIDGFPAIACFPELGRQVELVDGLNYSSLSTQDYCGTSAGSLHCDWMNKLDCPNNPPFNVIGVARTVFPGLGSIDHRTGRLLTCGELGFPTEVGPEW